MKRIPYTFLAVLIFLTSCTPSDVRFIKAQPESLERLCFIPNKFQGIFLINKDTVVVTNYTINGDTINSEALVVKGWGNYLFVNSLENGVYKLVCAKSVNAWGNEEICLEYFVLGDNDSISNLPDEFTIREREQFWMEQVNNMITDKSNPIIDLDTTNGYFILDNVSVNQFQSLLNNASSEEVNRIE